MSDQHAPPTEQRPGSDSGGTSGSSSHGSESGQSSASTDYGTETCPTSFTDSQGWTWTSSGSDLQLTNPDTGNTTSFGDLLGQFGKRFWDGLTAMLPENDGTCEAESHGTGHPLQTSSGTGGELRHDQNSFADLIRAAQALPQTGQHGGGQGTSQDLHLSLLHLPAAAENLVQHLTTAHDPSIVAHVPVAPVVVHEEQIAVHAPVIDQVVHH